MRQQRGAKTPLKAVMEQRGVTQKELAEACGVSAQTVYYWVAGRRPVPPGRAQVIADTIGVGVEVFDSMLTPEERARGLRLQEKGEPKTLLAFCVRSVWSGLGDSYVERCERLAEVAGATLYEMRDWLDGRTKIPAEVLRVWADELLPGLNPIVFRYEAEVIDPDAEPFAVLHAVNVLRARKLATFDEALEVLRKLQLDFLNGVQVSDTALKKALDNGREVPELLAEKARSFANDTGDENE